MLKEMRAAFPAPPAADAAPDNAAVRASIYDGALLQRPAGPAALALTDLVRAQVRAAFPDVDPRRAHRALPVPEVLARVGTIRTELRDARFAAAARALLAETGFDPADNALDHVRLRAILPGGHHNPAARPAYAVHRDTWYGSPRAQINWWIPLFDVSTAESIFFYPDLFGQPVDNDSAGFDYDRFVRSVGWQRQDRPRDAVYPGALGDLSAARRVGVALPAATPLLFSAAHLHGTSGIEDHPDPPPGAPAGFVRFSIDFRSVHLLDHREGRGAPDGDNRSTGSALLDYAWPDGSRPPSCDTSRRAL